MLEGKKLVEVRPSLWNYPGWYAMCLILIGITGAVAWQTPWGWLILCLLVIPLVAILWNRAGMRITVYEDQVESSRGVLNKTENHISCADVRAIETEQKLIQRIFNIGTLRIGTAGTEGWEEEVFGIPDPSGVKDLILQQKRLQIEKRSGARNDGE